MLFVAHTSSTLLCAERQFENAKPEALKLLFVWTSSYATRKFAVALIRKVSLY